MESKLKALKVVDLKDILSKAAISVPAKANKNDLIAKILANPVALEQYNKIHSKKTPTLTSNDDLLAPPEDVDWNTDDATTSEAAAPSKPTSKLSRALPLANTPLLSKPKSELPATATTVNSPTPATVQATDDDELEKRKHRAARFGIPLVEPPKPRVTATSQTVSKQNGTTLTPDDPAKLDARAARFGIVKAQTPSTAAATGKKRSAHVEEVDTEELERRRKRAERFGTAPVSQSV